MRNMFALVAALTILSFPLVAAEAGDKTKIRVYGTVESIDLAKNEISVKAQDGKSTTFKVDQRSDIEIELRNSNHDTDATLQELKVGDTVKVKAYPPMKAGEGLPLVDDLEIHR